MRAWQNERHHHRIASWLDKHGLKTIDAAIDKTNRPRVILLQYVPQGFGKLYNTHLAGFLRQRRQKGDRIWLMVHEPYYPFAWSETPKRWLLSYIHRRILRALVGASDRIMTSTEGFIPCITKYSNKPVEALAIPAIIEPDSQLMHAPVHHRPTKRVATFSGFGREISAALAETIPAILRSDTAITYQLIGKKSPSVRNRILERDRGMEPRIMAQENLSLAEITNCLLASDVMIQPYVEGVTTRRTSLMTCLAHGRAIVASKGFLTEGVWTETQCVELASDSETMVQLCCHILNSPEAKAHLQAKAHSTYQARFSLDVHVAALIAGL